MLGHKIEGGKGTFSVLDAGAIRAQSISLGPNDNTPILDVMLDDGSTVSPDNTGLIDIMGLGGNFTLSNGGIPNTVQITDKRNITPFVVGLNPLEAEYTDIQTAISAVISQGGTGMILVQAGTYTNGFSLNVQGITIRGIDPNAVIISGPCQMYAGEVANIQFSNTVTILGDNTTVVNFTFCRFYAPTTALNVNASHPAKQTFMNNCSGRGGVIQVNNGALIGTDCAFTGSTIQVFSSQASLTTGSVTFIRMNCLSFIFSGDNALAMSQISLENVSINTLQVGSNDAHVCQFLMRYSFARSISVHLFTPANLPSSLLHTYDAIFDHISMLDYLNGFPTQFTFLGGKCTIVNSCFAKARNAIGGTPLLHYNVSNVSLTKHILQVRGCTFSLEGDDPSTISAIKVESGSGTLFTGCNCINAARPYSGISANLSAINDASGGSVTITSDLVF